MLEILKSINILTFVSNSSRNSNQRRKKKKTDLFTYLNKSNLKISMLFKYAFSSQPKP